MGGGGFCPECIPIVPVTTARCHGWTWGLVVGALHHRQEGHPPPTVPTFLGRKGFYRPADGKAAPLFHPTDTIYHAASFTGRRLILVQMMRSYMQNQWHSNETEQTESRPRPPRLQRQQAGVWWCNTDQLQGQRLWLALTVAISRIWKIKVILLNELNRFQILGIFFKSS